MTSTPTDPRTDAPDLPSGRVELRPPPRLEADDGAGGVLVTAVPMLGGLGSVVLLATMNDAGPRGLVLAGTLLAASLGFVVLQVDRQRRQRHRRTTAARTAYLRHLADVRERVRDAATRQRRALAWRHPDPGSLPALAAERSRLWSRGPDDPDFLQVRYGVSARPSVLDLVPPEDLSDDDADPVALDALRRLLAAHGLVPELPASIDLREWARVRLDIEQGRTVARTLVCSATAFHAPEHLAVAVLCSRERLAEWDWVKWLPHARSGRRRDPAGAARMVATRAADLAALLPEDGPTAPHLLLVVDGADDVPLPHRQGATVIELSAAVGDLAGEPDRCSIATAEAFARRVGHLGAGTTETVEPRDELADVRAFDPSRSWRPRPARERLRVTIGRGADGAPVHLDLKEAAQQGMGPHGLVVGATGSGKSELLRTLVLGLATTHSPERLHLVLVDFKGGATFAGMSAMPHVSAVITNLEEDLALVDRMQDALAGEMVRRQQLLREAGGFASVRDYDEAGAAGGDLPPLPTLLVVVDEFSEMLAAKPELVDLFVAIGRLGRSLGLHLLLASQRLDEGRLRGLESHLSYRICLRTFSTAESRAVLGVPDAHDLPPTPGAGYLRTGPTTLQRFDAAYVSGPQPLDTTPYDEPPGILPFTVTPLRDVAETTRRTRADVGTRLPSDSLFTTAVRRMAGHGPLARQIWLPPLDRPDTLDGLVRAGVGGLVVPLGTVDRPREQRRDALVVDLAGAGGHVAVVGGPRSGTSTLLRTLVASLSLTTTPVETQVFVLDLGGGGFAPLAGLPHVAGLATRSEPDVVRRIVAEVRGIVDARETYFRSEGVDSIEDYRARRAAGHAGDGYGDVFLVVDGWSTVRADFEELEAAVQQLASRGLTYGVHLLIGAARWADLRPATRDLLGTRLELRLGEPMDSEIDRRAAALVPVRRPGRGLTPHGLHFLAALPRIDGVPDAATVGAGLTDLVSRVAAAWTGPAAPRLRLLPERVPLDDVRAQVDGPGPGLLLGLAERDLGPVVLDVDADPHLLVFGDSGSGRTSVLRTYADEVVRTRTPRTAQLVVVDYRRSLLGEVPEEFLLAHLSSATQAQGALHDLAAYLRGRLPGPDVTPEQLRDRSWWTGAEVFVLVDDHDLVAGPHTTQSSPLLPLLPLLPQARDVGLHLVVARRSGGAARALYEPVLQALRDLASPGLLLSGSPDEGPLLGAHRPHPAPPGRARLVSRDRDAQVVQVAYRAPAL